MLVKGTTDLIRQFMLKNHIEYLDADGWNEIFYHELDADEREIAMDLTPIYTYLLEYVAMPIVDRLEEQGESVEYVTHFGVDMDTEQLTVDIEMVDGSRKVIEL